MNSNPFDRFADHVVLRETSDAFALSESSEGRGIAGLAVIDARRLYRAEAHDSLLSYCVNGLGMSEDVAGKRIRVARLGQQFPCVLAALAERKLNPSAVLMLSTYLNEQNAGELVAAAAHLTRSKLQLLLANRFPRPDIAPEVKPIAAPASQPVLATPPMNSHACQPAPGRVGMTTPEHVTPPAPRAKVTPIAPERFAVQLTISQETHDKLRYAQALLGHALPSGDLSQVLARALEAIPWLRQFGTRVDDSSRAAGSSGASAGEPPEAPA